MGFSESNISPTKKRPKTAKNSIFYPKWQIWQAKTIPKKKKNCPQKKLPSYNLMSSF